LQTFRSLVRPGWSEGIRAELKWFAAVLGEARDADVLMDRMVANLAQVGGSAAGRHALLQRLAREREDAQARLHVALADARHARLLEALSAAAREPVLAAHADDPARDVLPGLAAKPWGRLQGAVQRLGEVPPDPELHDVRIRAKAARYAAEAVVPVAGAPARRYAEAVAGVQESLGDYHDAVVAREWLQRAAGSIRRGGTLLIRALDERECVRGAEALAAWRPAWKLASRKQLRSWMSNG
ncbi:MAG: CHAD domain-containing protein, partial [Candidatus Dormibacteraeota bacterium]|nr:CHAD domain-containing protein [Candidatus Dormibacteraeota bacterium]